MQEGIEFIFVNDCTKDNSIEILKNTLENYPQRKSQVKIIHHEVNQGLTGARNTALKYARGEYITHCDSDDWVDLKLYENLYNTAIKNDSDVAIFSIKLMESPYDEVKKICSKEYSSIDSFFNDNFATENFNSLVNKMFHRRIALNNDIIAPATITFGEDLLRTTQMLLRCSSIAFCNTVFYYYFKGNIGASTHTWSEKNFIDFSEVVKILEPILERRKPELIKTLWGYWLIAAVKTASVNKKFYKVVLRKYFKPILHDKRLSKMKRGVISLSYFSIHLAHICCLLQLQFKHKLKINFKR